MTDRDLPPSEPSSNPKDVPPGLVALAVVVGQGTGVLAAFGIGGLGMACVLAYLFMTRPLHGAGPFPDGIYLIPLVLGLITLLGGSCLTSFLCFPKQGAGRCLARGALWFVATSGIVFLCFPRIIGFCLP